MNRIRINIALLFMVGLISSCATITPLTEQAKGKFEQVKSKVSKKETPVAFENESTSLKGDSILIKYDLVGTTPIDSVWAEVSTTNGSKISPRPVAGDVGNNVSAGKNKQIVWNYAKSGYDLGGRELVVTLKAATKQKPAPIKEVKDTTPSLIPINQPHWFAQTQLSVLLGNNELQNKMDMDFLFGYSFSRHFSLALGITADNVSTPTYRDEYHTTKVVPLYLDARYYLNNADTTDRTQLYFYGDYGHGLKTGEMFGAGLGLQTYLNSRFSANVGIGVKVHSDDYVVFPVTFGLRYHFKPKSNLVASEGKIIVEVESYKTSDGYSFGGNFIKTRQFNPYFSLGIGIGYHWLSYDYTQKNYGGSYYSSYYKSNVSLYSEDTKTNKLAFVPIFLDNRFYLREGDFQPFAYLDYGFAFALKGDGAWDTNLGFTSSFGLGLRYSKLAVSLGWAYHQGEYSSPNEQYPRSVTNNPSAPVFKLGIVF